MSSLAIQRYTHVPLFVEAVQVTVENMAEVAVWCNGSVLTDENGKNFVKAVVFRPNHERQTRAYVGDWVLKTEIGIKCYTDKAFAKGFVAAPQQEMSTVS